MAWITPVTRFAFSFVQGKRPLYGQRLSATSCFSLLRVDNRAPALRRGVVVSPMSHRVTHSTLDLGMGPETRAGFRLAWLTDLHLNFLPYALVDEFLGRVETLEPDAVLITGDISEARDLNRMLVHI